MVSHTEQCPHYSHAAASSCRGPGGPGGREQSIQAASHIFSLAAAPAAGSKPACTCRGEANVTCLVCAAWVFWGLVYISFLRKCLSSDSFLFVLFTNKTSAEDLFTPTDLLGVFARGRINPESGD